VCSQQAHINRSLGLTAATQPGKIANVELVGPGGKPVWEQAASGLRVKLAWQEDPVMAGIRRRAVRRECAGR
jgi:hypothetical protein